jgi:hypothetical protein
MTICSLCQKDSKYDLDISRTRIPFRRAYDLSLCDEHKETVIKILDGLMADYYFSVSERKQS